MMTSKAIIHDENYYERLGFRNAWISATQVPLVYLLATKSSVIGYIIGSSHERLNWLHRWVSRTLLLTVTVHGGSFIVEWARADFLQLELDMMPMVKYGLGAWAVLVWTFLSSLSPLRRMAYELFVLQHIAAAGIFLWLVYVHVPAYARYNIWFAIAAISSDRILRSILVLKNFCSILVLKNFCHKGNWGSHRIGHKISAEAMSDLTIVTIRDVHVSWKAGQHVYLWLPYLGALESHPFTIASLYTECHCNEIQLVIRAHSGFSRRIHEFAKNQRNSLTGFISGPYGAPPRWEAFETLVLISASTGASYTLPVLESLLASPTICTQRISFLLLARERSHCEYYESRLSQAIARAEERGIELDVEIAITGQTSLIERESRERAVEARVEDKSDEIVDEKAGLAVLVNEDPSFALSSPSQSVLQSNQCYSCSSRPCCCAGPSTKVEIVCSYARPDLGSFIRGLVEKTGGETGIAVCGGKGLVSTVRNDVARLSDERGVHKGTGAQGIYLHVEEFGF